MVFNEYCMLCFDSGAALADEYKSGMLNNCDRKIRLLRPWHQQANE